MSEPKSAPAKRNLTVPILLLLGGGIIYASFFSANRVAIDAGMPPMALAFWQALFGGFGLLIFSTVIRQLPGTSFAHLRQYTVAAVIGFSIPLIALTVASGRLPPGVLTLVVTLTPALTYLFAFLARLDRFNLWSIGGVLLGLVGVLLIVLPAGSLGAEFSPAWLLLGLVAPLGYALNNIAVVFLRPAQTTSLHLSTGVLLVATVVLLPVMLVVDGLGGLHQRRNFPLPVRDHPPGRPGVLRAVQLCGRGRRDRLGPHHILRHLQRLGLGGHRSHGGRSGPCQRGHEKIGKSHRSRGGEGRLSAGCLRKILQALRESPPIQGGAFRWSSPGCCS